MSDAVLAYLHEQAYRLRDLDSHSGDATMLELAAKRIAELEAELASRPTAWAYQQSCRALEHWRVEAHRLAVRLGVEPMPMPKREPGSVQIYPDAALEPLLKD